MTMVALVNVLPLLLGNTGFCTAGPSGELIIPPVRLETRGDRVVGLTFELPGESGTLFLSAQTLRAEADALEADTLRRGLPLPVRRKVGPPGATLLEYQEEALRAHVCGLALPDKPVISTGKNSALLQLTVAAAKFCEQHARGCDPAAFLPRPEVSEKLQAPQGDEVLLSQSGVRVTLAPHDFGVHIRVFNTSRVDVVAAVSVELECRAREAKVEKTLTLRTGAESKNDLTNSVSCPDYSRRIAHSARAQITEVGLDRPCSTDPKTGEPAWPQVSLRRRGRQLIGVEWRDGLRASGFIPLRSLAEASRGLEPAPENLMRIESPDGQAVVVDARVILPAVCGPVSQSGPSAAMLAKKLRDLFDAQSAGAQEPVPTRRPGAGTRN